MTDEMIKLEKIHGELMDAFDEIARLREEVELWKSRWEAERADHETTMKQCDEYWDDCRGWR